MSPYKNAAWLNELGLEAEEKYGVKFLPSDFKKKGRVFKEHGASKRSAVPPELLRVPFFEAGGGSARRGENLDGTLTAPDELY